MPVETRTELIEVLSSGRFGEIVGTEEGDQIEFKSHAYNHALAKDQADLVADVASFANFRGGTIVLGVETTKETTNRREAANRVVGVKPGAVNEDAYRKLILNHVRPLVRHFDIRTYPSEGDDRSLVALHIEPQDDWDRPFLVDRIVDESQSDRSIPHAVGWPTRSGSETHWEDPSRIQQLVAAGLRQGSPNTPTELDDTRDADANSQLEMLSERIPEWDDQPTITVQLIPEKSMRAIADFYGSFSRDIRQWHGIRAHGFGLGLQYSRFEPVGDGLGSFDDSGPSVIVSRWGTTTSACIVSPNYLGWNQTFTGERAVINATALIEFITETIRFAYDYVKPRLSDEDVSWTIRCRVRNWKRGAADVVLNRNRTRGQISGSFQLPTSDSVDVEVESSSGNDFYRDAGSLVKELLGREFRLGEDDVPYLEEGRINLDLIPNV